MSYRDQPTQGLRPPANLSPVKGALSPSDAIRSLPGGASSTPTQLRTPFQKLQNREILLPERRRSLKPLLPPPPPSEYGSDLLNVTRDFTSKMTFLSSDSSHSRGVVSPGRISFVYSDEVVRALDKVKKSPRPVAPSMNDIRIYRLPSLVQSAAPRPPFTPGTVTAVKDAKGLPEAKQFKALPKLKKNPKLISEDRYGVYFRWFADQHSTIGGDFDIPKRPPGPPKRRKEEEESPPQRSRTDASPVITVSVASQTDPEPIPMLTKPSKRRKKSNSLNSIVSSTPRW